MTDFKSQLTFDDKVIQKIVGDAIKNVEGLLDVNGGFFSNLSDKVSNSTDLTKGIDAQIDDDHVELNIEAITEFGKPIPEIFENMKKSVSREVKKMTGLDLSEFNVKAVDIKTAEQHADDSETLQDKASNATDSVKNATVDAANNAKDAVNNN